MTTLGIPLDDLFERLLTPIMHVGCIELDVPQRRCLERTLVLLKLGLIESPKIRLLRGHPHP